MANSADQAAGAPWKRQRLQWSEADTWSLIRLWEDNLDSLRAQKHNGEVYASIAAALTSAGVSRTKDQVHKKIENLTHTYRKCLKKETTGSSRPNWPFFAEIHRFLGSLPVNDPSLMEEAGISSSPASSSP
ncbi:myb/SANT-like DNA-binding domain-containing protein 1 [Rhipicephalus microplus]|uniref:myb/SANT-like DNA-binding domain-containing protein 1 n=1 Tax=Rhipicephalus microplus TaxID=6941 RepID=UPI003F6D92F6